MLEAAVEVEVDEAASEVEAFAGLRVSVCFHSYYRRQQTAAAANLFGPACEARSTQQQCETSYKLVFNETATLIVRKAVLDESGKAKPNEAVQMPVRPYGLPAFGVDTLRNGCIVLRNTRLL
nr:uncharacterized protein LOC129380238 [Dermacentor andersoni]